MAAKISFLFALLLCWISSATPRMAMLWKDSDFSAFSTPRYSRWAQASAKMAYVTGEFPRVSGSTSCWKGLPVSSRKTMRWDRTLQKWSTSARRFCLPENSEKVGELNSSSGELTGQGAIMAKSGSKDLDRGTTAVLAVLWPSSERASSPWLSGNSHGENGGSAKPSKVLSDGLRRSGSSRE